MELKIEYMRVDDLKPYPNNARQHKNRDIDAIAQSIEQFGFDDPIGIWGDENVIVEGHGRREAAKLLGMDVVPVIRLDHLTDEQRKAYALACSNAGGSSERNLYGLAKGYDVITPTGGKGYHMVLNRRRLTVSDTVKSTSGRGSW